MALERTLLDASQTLAFIERRRLLAQKAKVAANTSVSPENDTVEDRMSKYVERYIDHCKRFDIETEIKEQYQRMEKDTGEDDWEKVNEV